MHNELYHHGVKGMKWGVRKDKKKNKSQSVKKPKLTRSQMIGYAAATMAISVIGVKIATSPKLRGLVYKGMSATTKISEDFSPVVVDKFGRIVDIEF